MPNHPNSAVEIYQFHLLLLEISPAIWRRILVRSDCTILDFHNIGQIVMDWDDDHLHRFLIHGKEYGLKRRG